jgi:hypothetical protein
MAVSRARHHEVAHAIVAIDQRGRRAAFVDDDVRTRIDPASFQSPDILRQAKNAVRVAADEIGLDHALRDKRRVIPG